MKSVFLLTLSLLLCFSISRAQNFLYNNDFEIYSDCPTYLDMVDQCSGWYEVVQSPDYYNCNFLIDFNYPTEIVGASSGTGFMGFANYGDANGSSEAIGQTLDSPLLPGTNYFVNIAVKKTNGGAWSGVCAGVALYGFKDSLPLNNASVHAEDLPGSMLLGKTDTISNTVWEQYSFSVTPIDTINHIVFSTTKTPLCPVCVFIDNAMITDQKATGTQHEPELRSRPDVFPNPNQGIFTVSVPKLVFNYSIDVTDITGRVVYRAVEKNSFNHDINISNSDDGFYLVRITAECGFQSAVPVQLMR